MRTDPLTTHAYCNIVGGVSPTITNQKGIDTITRLGVGAYNLLLIEPLDQNDCFPLATLRDQAVVLDGVVTFQKSTDDTSILVTIAVAGVAADGDVSVIIKRGPPT
jgi:hypothetical protein